MLRRKILAVVTTLALALGMSVGGAATAFANPNNGSEMNQTSYWKNQYPHAVECYKHDGSGGEHGREIDGGVRLNTFQQSWPGNRWEVLIVKGGSGDNFGNAVYPLPEANKVYYAPNNKNTTTPADVSHWIVCKGSTPAAASVSVTPETCTSPAKLVLGATTQARFDTATYTNVTGGQNYTVVARAIDSATFPIGTPNMNQARTQVTFTGFLPNANPANCPTATADVVFGSPTCQSGAPAITAASFTGVANATGQIVKNGSQGGAVEVVFTANQGTTFSPSLAGTRDGKTYTLSANNTKLTVTGTLPGPDQSLCPVPVSLSLTYMTACAPDDTNTWRVTNPSDKTITVSWRNASNTLSGTHTATPGQTTFETPRGTETMIITWGGGDSGVIPGDTRKASGNDEDCSVAVALTLTYMTACAPDDTNTWRVINPSDRDIVVTWAAYGTNRTGQFTAKPGENVFETARGSETMIISWGGDAYVKAGSTQKASGVDQDCSVSIPLNLTYMTACAPDDTNTWRVTNPSETTVTVTWRTADNSRSGTHEATPGQSIFETPRGTETMIITWGDGVTVKEGKVTKASGKDQDCSVPVAISLTYMTACAPDDTNTWRITNPSERDVVVTWTAYGTDRTGQVTAKPGQTILELPRTSETLVLTWGGDAYVKPGKTTKASGVDIICDEISFQDVVLECDGTPGSYTLPNLPGVTWTVNGVEKIPGAHALVDAGEITVVATAENGYRFPDNATSKTFTFAATDEEECIEPTLEGSIATTACETDVPYILFSISLNDPDNQSTAGLEDAEIIFSGLDSEGNEREYVLDNLEGTLVDGVFSGRVLWPGAAIEDGQAAGWPGWALVDGEWQNVGDDNFGWTRGLDSVTLSVNPTLEVELSYPAATPECATEPTAVEPTIEYSYSCDFGGTIELSDTPGVIWTVDGEQTDQRVWTGLDIDFAPVITASLDPEMIGMYFGPEAMTGTTVEFELPEEGCDLVTSPLVTPTLSTTQATCTTAGSYTLNAIEGVQWLVNGQVTAPGTYTATTGSTVEVEAVALQGFGFGFETQTEWTLSFPAPAGGCVTLTDLPTLALTGASGMLGTVGIIALLITLTGIGAVVARRRVEA